MGDEIDPNLMTSIKGTQDTLGKYVTKPPMTEKLLSRPPFRFLHDVIMAVMNSKGLFQGLWDPSEMDAGNLKTRETKTKFMQKFVDALQMTIGESIPVKVSKILAGQDPEATNYLLTALGRALDQGLSGEEAVRKISGGKIQEKEEVKPAKAQEKAQKSDEPPKTYRASSRERPPLGVQQGQDKKKPVGPPASKQAKPSPYSQTQANPKKLPVSKAPPPEKVKAPPEPKKAPPTRARPVNSKGTPSPSNTRAPSKERTPPAQGTKKTSQTVKSTTSPASTSRVSRQSDAKKKSEPKRTDSEELDSKGGGDAAKEENQGSAEFMGEADNLLQSSPREDENVTNIVSGEGENGFRESAVEEEQIVGSRRGSEIPEELNIGQNVPPPPQFEAPEEVKVEEEKPLKVVLRDRLEKKQRQNNVNRVTQNRVRRSSLQRRQKSDDLPPTTEENDDGVNNLEAPEAFKPQITPRTPPKKEDELKPKAPSRRNSLENNSVVKSSALTPLKATVSVSSTSVGSNASTAKSNSTTSSSNGQKGMPARPPSARQAMDAALGVTRPPSARPAPPRPRTGLIQEEPVSNFRPQTGKVANVFIEGKKDEEEDEEDSNFVVQEAILTENERKNSLEMGGNERRGSLDGVLDGLVGEGEEGFLVKQIIDTKRELENSGRTGKGGELEGLDPGSKSRETTVAEIERIKELIQSMARSANPLGKMMDFVQEDVDAMHREMLKWKEESAKLDTALEAEQLETEKTLAPLRTQLKEVEEAIQDREDAISATRMLILRQEEKIQKILQGLDRVTKQSVNLTPFGSFGQRENGI